MDISSKSRHCFWQKLFRLLQEDRAPLSRAVEGAHKPRSKREQDRPEPAKLDGPGVAEQDPRKKQVDSSFSTCLAEVLW